MLLVLGYWLAARTACYWHLNGHKLQNLDVTGTGCRDWFLVAVPCKEVAETR